MPKSSETAALEKMDAQMKKALRPAEVALNVTGFKDVLAVRVPAAKRASLLTNSLSNCRGTTATMTMSEPHPLVRVDSKEPDTLKIKSPGATIRFTLKSDEFYPVGIAFLLREGVARPNDEQKLGLLNFDQSKIRRFGHVQYITDTFKDEKPYDRYKFSVIIQRASDGAIGIIDPGIEHES